jgi:hypothetical protein
LKQVRPRSHWLRDSKYPYQRDARGHDGEAQRPQRIETSDLAILPLGAGHTLASAPKLKPVPVMREVRANSIRDGSVFKIGGNGEATHVVRGQFSFDGVLAPKLLKALPPLMLIRAQGRPLEWLRLTSHVLTEETRFPKPGSTIMIARLLDLLFIQAVRESRQVHANSLGWLSGLRVSQIGRSLSIPRAPGPSRDCRRSPENARRRDR